MKTELRETIADAIRLRMRTKDICRKFHVSRFQVYRIEKALLTQQWRRGPSETCRQSFKLLAQGLTVKEMANRLGISIISAKSYARRYPGFPKLHRTYLPPQSH